MKTTMTRLGWVLGMLSLFASHSLVRAQENPQFTGYSRITNGELRLGFNSPAGGLYRLDVSSNILDWESWRTFRSTGLNQHTDTVARLLPARFYRGRQVSGTNIVTGDHLSTSDGDVVIHPINHATLLLRWKDLTIAIDPASGRSTDFASLPKANVVLITHEHQDHFSATTLNAVWQPGTAILAPNVVYTKLTTAQKNDATLLNNGDSANLLGMHVQAFPAYNYNEPSTNHLRGVGNGYILSMGGRRIYISGDTSATPEMLMLTNIDVAFLSMNRPYTMTLTNALAAVREFRPAVVYPYHYRNSDNTFTDLKSFQQQVEQTHPDIEVRLRSWY